MTQPESPSSPAPDAVARKSAPPFVGSFAPAPVPAPFLSRLVAFVIDFGGTVAITTGIVVLCVTVGFAGYNGVSGGGNSFLVLVGIIAIFVIPLTAVIINVRLARTRLYSLGKLLMRIRIVDARTNGPVTTGRLVKRVAVLIVPGLITLLALPTLLTIVGASPAAVGGPSILAIVVPLVWIVMLVPMLRGDRRGWQDRAADTRVVTAASVAVPRK